MKTNLIFRESSEGIYQWMQNEVYNEIDNKRKEISAVEVKVDEEKLKWLQTGKWSEVSEYIKDTINKLIT